MSSDWIPIKHLKILSERKKKALGNLHRQRKVSVL
jgi:hypothetical protein